MLNWKRDYSNFSQSYELQLSKKLNFVILNIEKILNHLKINTDKVEDISVEAIFIVNHPTFYMYDGKYKTHSFYSFCNFLKGKDEQAPFHYYFIDSKEYLTVNYPYFKNASNYINRDNLS